MFNQRSKIVQLGELLNLEMQFQGTVEFFSTIDIMEYQAEYSRYVVH